MRAVVTIAMVAMLLGVVGLCPALACFTPAHACCPTHHAPAARQDCPSQMLEKGKTAPLVSQVMAAPLPSAVRPPVFQPLYSQPTANIPAGKALFLRVCVLRI